LRELLFYHGDRAAGTTPYFRPNALVRLPQYADQDPQGEFTLVKKPLAAHWVALDNHFRRHAKLVERFRHASAGAVARMWKSQTNEDGKRLSQFERDALIERYCELFGTWPD